jgi:hypothetical protein
MLDCRCSQHGGRKRYQRSAVLGIMVPGGGGEAGGTQLMFGMTEKFKGWGPPSMLGISNFST